MRDAHEIASCDFGICEAKQHQHSFRSAILMNPGWLKFARRREKRRTTFSVRRLAFGVRRSAFGAGGAVGTRSRAIRGSRSDDRVGCSASDGRYAPARPALQVSTRLLTFLPHALASTGLYSVLSIIAPSVNVLRRTRRKPSTIRGAATEVVIGQSAAARAGARPYRAACAHLLRHARRSRTFSHFLTS